MDYDLPETSNGGYSSVSAPNITINCRDSYAQIDAGRQGAINEDHDQVNTIDVKKTFFSFFFFIFLLQRVFIMRPSSLGGGRIMRRTLSVRLSVCLSVRPVIVTERHVAPPSELQ